MSLFKRRELVDDASVHIKKEGWILRQIWAKYGDRIIDMFLKILEAKADEIIGRWIQKKKDDLIKKI